jgi:hypothetical protein
MTHSLNKEASQLLCEAMQCLVEDGEASAEAWKDSNGRAMAPDRFWNTGIESDIAGDDEGSCMGIELNIWERMKVSNLLYIFIDLMHIICIIYIINIILKCFPRYVVISCTQWWEVEGSVRGMPPSITAKYIRETLVSSAITPFSQFCLTNLLGFCLNITHIALKASIFRNCPQTEVTLMCTERFLMIRYKPFVILCALPSPVHGCA